MPKRHINRFVNQTRTCKAQLTFEEASERLLEEHRVVYRMMSPKLERELAEAAKQSEDEQDEAALAQQLAGLVTDFPDMYGGTEEAPEKVTVTKELLEGFGWDNLVAITNAINEDLNPSKKSETSSPSS
jgi:hypothetical protein